MSKSYLWSRLAFTFHSDPGVLSDVITPYDVDTAAQLITPTVINLNDSIVYNAMHSKTSSDFSKSVISEPYYTSNIKKYHIGSGYEYCMYDIDHKDVNAYYNAKLFPKNRYENMVLTLDSITGDGIIAVCEDDNIDKLATQNLSQVYGKVYTTIKHHCKDNMYTAVIHVEADYVIREQLYNTLFTSKEDQDETERVVCKVTDEVQFPHCDNHTREWRQ